MTAISDFCDTIRGWLNFEYSDTLITSWVRMAEEQMSTTLRCKHMIAIDTAYVANGRVKLPDDWLGLDFARIVDGKPLHFRTRDDFYNVPPNQPHYNEGYYTITGNYLITPAGTDNGLSVELSYYEHIPPLGDEPNWLMKYYSRLYVSSVLAVAASYSLEDDRAVMWQTASQTFIDQINEEHQKSKASGSRVSMPRKKGFG